ncbi:MAG: geranylgeranylglycerol-phosphate geranylgeranyltransferase [Candidatus Bathyarchaeia archaeon]
MSKAKAYIKLIRPINCVMMGFAVIVGATLAGRETLTNQPQNLLLGFLTGFFLTGAAMAVNDYYDRAIDAINEPERPIPSGTVGPNEALGFAFFLTVTGFAAALWTGATPNWQCLAIAAVSWMIVILYATKAKRTGLPGNLAVSSCIAIPFIYGGFVIGKGLLPTTSIFVIMVFLSNTGREITKGIVDVQGDKENNIKTVAVLHGEKKAASTAAVFYFSAVFITPLPWLWGIVTFWYLPLVILTDLGLIWASVRLLQIPSRENAKKIKNRTLLWFFTGLLAFIAGA